MFDRWSSRGFANLRDSRSIRRRGMRRVSAGDHIALNFSTSGAVLNAVAGFSVFFSYFGAGRGAARTYKRYNCAARQCVSKRVALFFAVLVPGAQSKRPPFRSRNEPTGSRFFFFLSFSRFFNLAHFIFRRSACNRRQSTIISTIF